MRINLAFSFLIACLGFGQAACDGGSSGGPDAAAPGDDASPSDTAAVEEACAWDTPEPGEDTPEPGEDTPEPGEDTTDPGEDTTEPPEDSVTPPEDTLEDWTGADVEVMELVDGGWDGIGWDGAGWDGGDLDGIDWESGSWDGYETWSWDGYDWDGIDWGDYGGSETWTWDGQDWDFGSMPDIGGDGWGCDGITEVGCCDGAINNYCSGGVVIKEDCGDYSTTCGWDPILEYYTCFAEGSAPGNQPPIECP